MGLTIFVVARGVERLELKRLLLDGFGHREDGPALIQLYEQAANEAKEGRGVLFDVVVSDAMSDDDRPRLRDWAAERLR